MFCSNCGAALAAGVRFCGNCGAASPAVSFQQQAPVKAKSSGCLKVFLFGCLFLIVAAVILFAAGGYLMDRFVGETIASEGSSFGKRAEQLQKSNPFRESADGRITEDQLRRFLGVSQKCMETVNFPEVQKEIDRIKNSENPYWDGYKFFKEFGNRYRNALLDALEAHKMSLPEYQYIHKNALKSYGAVLKKESGTLFTQQQEEGAEENPAPQMPEIPDDVKKFLDDATTVPPENITVIENQRAEVDKYLPSAPFAKMLFPLLVDPDNDSLF